MKVMKPKTVFLCLVVMACLPAAGYASTLQEAIGEALMVPFAVLEALEAQADFEAASASDYEAARKKTEAAQNERLAAEDEWEAAKYEVRNVDRGGSVLWWLLTPEETKEEVAKGKKAELAAAEKKQKAAWEKLAAAEKKHSAARENETAIREKWEAVKKAAYASAIADSKARTRQGKKRARHCRATLKPVDDHVEIVEIVECVQTMEAIADACSTATQQFRGDKKLQASLDTEANRLKEYVTRCVTANITGYSALVHYIVTPGTKDRYAGLIEKCRQEKQNTLGVLGYEFIWPCFKGYLDMIDEPLEPPPTEISPEPDEDSDTLPKVKA